MKKYCIVDQTTGDWFEEILGDTTEEEAIKSADLSFSYLTKSDLKKRTAFFLAYGELDEEGCFDLDTADVIKEYI